MHERTAEVVRWQPASSSISHVFGRICRSWITLTSIPLLLFLHHTTCSPYVRTLYLDTWRVRVCMFGYAKCSRASQVECLMALFCLNTDLDTTAERHLRICIHSPAAPTCLLLGYAKLSLRVSRSHWITSKNSVSVLRELEMRFGFSKTQASRYVTGKVYAQRYPLRLHQIVKSFWCDMN